MLTWITALTSRFRQSRDGAVAIQVGLLAVVLIGMSALGVEIGFAYYKQRQMQSAADAAATGGAMAIGDPTPDPTGEARSIAGRLTFHNGVGGVAVTVNHPPVSGAHAGDAKSVQVIIQQPQTLTMANLVTSRYGTGPSIWTVSASAVATANASGTACIIALDTGAVCNSTPAINIWNNAIIQPPGCNHCGLADNSSCTNALNVSNGAQINAPVFVHGQWILGVNAKLNCTPKTQGAPVVTDPYAGVVFSTVGSTPRTQPASAPYNLLPGNYASGVHITGGSGVTLNFTQKGVYYIGTRFDLPNTSTINATAGVTIVLNGNYTAALGNGTTINLVAPPDGPTAGIAFAAIRTATAQQTFSNNQILNIKGAMYFPSETLLIDNNVTIVATGCNQYIAKKIDYRNNAAISDTACPTVGGTPVAGGSGLVQLTE
jgi:hypothetical protein